MPVLPSNALITDTLNLIKNNTPYLALYTATPTPSGGGTEVTGGSYARLPITFGTISAGQMSNTTALTFSGLPNATVTHYGILTAVTAGALKVFGSINTTAVIISGDQIQFPIGSIVINLSGS